MVTVKRSLRFPFSFLVLLLLFISLGSTLLTPRRRYIPFLSISGEAPARSPSSLNETILLHLASSVPSSSEAELKRDVDEILDSASSDRGGLEIYRRRRGSHFYHRRGARYGIAGLGTSSRFLRLPKDFSVYPEFRRLLRDWFRLRRNQPTVMSELVNDIKAPIDSYNGRPEEYSSRKYSSCAVVGNSGILLKTDRGELIDSHELVIRLNNARTEGYQRNVGSKTGISFVNSNILHLCARRESCFCHPYGANVPIVMYICQPMHFLDYTVCNASHKAPLLITDPRFDLLCGRIVKYYSIKRFVEETWRLPEDWSKVHDEKAFHYSSGMQAVMLAIGICEKVSVFGFGKSAHAKHHYHTNQKAELDLHDYKAEYAFYKDLVLRPQVIPFLKDSGLEIPPVIFYY